MWRYVKIPKAIALLAFLLPWMTVSCSNTRIAEASGWELVLGKIHPVVASANAQPIDAHLNPYLAAAVALIVVGLIVALMRRRMAVVALVASIGAMALIWLGTSQYSNDRIAQAAAKQGRSDFDAAAASLIRVDWLAGYWIAMAALAAAALLAFLSINDRSAPPR